MGKRSIAITVITLLYLGSKLLAVILDMLKNENADNIVIDSFVYRAVIDLPSYTYYHIRRNAVTGS